MDGENHIKNILFQDMRKKRGFTQESLADKLGVSVNAIKKWEYGERFPSVENMRNLIEIFQMSATMLGFPELVGLSEEMSQEQVSEGLNGEQKMNGASRNEHPSTYIVQDRSNEEELARLRIQDRMMTIGMGGVLPEQRHPMHLRRVLDVGCGTGGWLIEMARAYPDIEALIGVDVSATMVAFAREQTQEQGASNRIEFQVMDALRKLEFPANYFDLVNQRLGQSYLRTWEWLGFIQRLQLITRPEGIIRLTEANLPESTSAALETLIEIFFQALVSAGHFFLPKRDGLTSQLFGLLKQMGIRDVQVRQQRIEYHAGTVEGENAYEDLKRAYRTLVPFFQKWTNVPKNYEEIYQQALVDMKLPGFTCQWNITTAWGFNHPIP